MYTRSERWLRFAEPSGISVEAKMNLHSGPRQCSPLQRHIQEGMDNPSKSVSGKN